MKPQINKKWYVYSLNDSETNVPFYIGKGQGYRMYNHFYNVKKHKIPNGNFRLYERIRSIIDGDKSIEYQIHFQTDNEKETQGVYLVDISSADIKELMNIPFIGYSKALNIIEYREQHGFSCIDDLKNVTGIGDKTFEKIRNYVTISTKKFEYRQTKVKINSDSIQKLEELEGIGEKTANIILEYRKIKTIENMDELKKITGMSDKQIEKIRGYIEF